MRGIYSRRDEMIEYEVHSYSEKWVVDTVQRAVETIAHQLTDTAKVERRTLIKVGRYLAMDEGNKRNRGHIGRLIFREVNDALKRNRREHAEHLADLTSSDEEGQAIEYEPQDVLANVNSRNLEIKETINLLAKEDRRKEFVLNAWADGYTDDTEISHILADVFTGQATGHLSFIKRFRKTCRTVLTAQAI
ncbi:hypothetical protein I2483_13825 [Sporosarcina sp. E16_3]|uniref:hypothetical protein n=1 Tax=Sporosarcina sp. E16_3 TaxID=2789293 RepID=UPI001A93803D|nr:hypothetical protein [Sporosarcina sp. E16_3]MBO0602742.1 hypothetical protein [Sporosarcina sp. E16_3]